MSAPRDPHDVVTSVQADPLLGARSAVRQRPQIGWTDRRGEHSMTLDARSVVGSAPGVDLTVDDAAVSRLHAELEPRDDGVWVHDLGSRNGTFIDTVRVASARVPWGGSVRFGSTVCVVNDAPRETTVPLWPVSSFGPLIGPSIVMRALFARLARVAALDVSVLVEGETGTGKELVAQAIHDASPRAAGPFVVVDCGALPEHLLEAELFGHAKGAFTGAASARAGAIEAANGGTLFLDEVGELPLAMQPKLLRATEARTIRRLGETAYRKVDVRFVSATHRDLRTMVNAGEFREDLYFRLSVVPLVVPSLRERPDDVLPLVQHFTSTGRWPPLEAAVTAELTRRPWHGNVRELRNFVERAAALGANEALAMAHGTTLAARAAPASLPEDLLAVSFRDARERWLQLFEREYIAGLLARHGRSPGAVADAAGVDRSYVHRLMRRYDL